MNKPARQSFFFLFLLCMFCSCRAETVEAVNITTLSQDRRYLESNCPMEGIQELDLRKDGEFELSSYMKTSNSRKQEFTGQWQLQENLLNFDWGGMSISFQIKSVVHSFIRDKFLYLSFKAIPGDPINPLDKCEFVDARVLDLFLSPDSKP